MKSTPLAAAAVTLGLCACQPPTPDTTAATQAGPDVEYLSTPEFAARGLPFSEAVRVGSMLYLSGQLGTVPGTGQRISGGIQPETRQTLENIKAVLERYGSSMDRIVKCTIMIDDMAEWPAMNEIYVEFFPGPKPVRSAFGADGLALGAAVEIECWATVG